MKRLQAVGGLLVVGQVIHSLRLKMDCKVSLWTWPKDIVVAGNGKQLAYHVPMQFLCIFFNRQDAKQYVHRCFHVSTYKVCYEPIIAPINGQNMWRPSGVQPIQPPIKKR